MTKKEELKSGKHQGLIDLLDIHNIITNKETAIKHADKLVPIAHQFIKDITSIIHPDEYQGAPNEFIEMVIASETYIAGSLLVCLFDMFPETTIKQLVKNYKLSLDSSIHLQSRINQE